MTAHWDRATHVLSMPVGAWIVAGIALLAWVGFWLDKFLTELSEMITRRGGKKGDRP